MGPPGSPAAAPSAAVLGSRNARRQLRSVLTAAAEVGAYSVGFSAVRGGLTGFTVYFAGDFAGAGRSLGAAATCAVPRPSCQESTGACAQPTARTPAASTAPASPAAPRRRGCRAGAKHRQRRQGACGRPQPTAPDAARAMPLEGDVAAQLPSEIAAARTHEPAAPPAPPLHTNTHTNTAQFSTLSPLAPTYSPPPPPPPFRPPSSSFPQEEEDPLLLPPELRHLLPHTLFSYEERRWDYYHSYGGPFPSHGSSHRKRPEPPSPPWPPSPAPSAIVGCVVNERRARAAPPPPPRPVVLPEARKR